MAEVTIKLDKAEVAARAELNKAYIKDLDLKQQYDFDKIPELEPQVTKFDLNENA